MLWAIVIILVALLISAFISGTEAAVIAVNKFHIRRMVREGNKRAVYVQRVLAAPEDFFGAILVANNVVNIFIASLIGALTAGLLGANSGASIAIATAVTSALIILISELTPKSIANAIPDRWTLATGKWLFYFIVVSKPFIKIFTVVPRWLRRLMKDDDKMAEPLVTARDLRFLIDISEEQGEVESMQGQMLDNVFRFGEKEIRDIMIPRTEMVMLEHDTSLTDFLALYNKRPHTRFPLLDKTKENIKGIISVKDVLARIAKDPTSLNIQITSFMRPVLYVPETKPLDDLFTLMRSTGHKMAISVDEFGSVAGLVTFTHLMEQIVGRSGEEGEQPKQLFTKVNSNTYNVYGGLSVEEANDTLFFGIPEGDYETVAGFFIDIVQRIPTPGERASSGHLRMTVLSMSDNRITLLRIEDMKPRPDMEHSKIS